MCWQVQKKKDTRCVEGHSAVSAFASETRSVVVSLLLAGREDGEQKEGGEK